MGNIETVILHVLHGDWYRRTNNGLPTSFIKSLVLEYLVFEPLVWPLDLPELILVVEK